MQKRGGGCRIHSTNLKYQQPFPVNNFFYTYFVYQFSSFMQLFTVCDKMVALVNALINKD